MRRVGRWQYERGIGWRLDDTDLVLDFDRLDHQGDLPGTYVIARVPRGQESCCLGTEAIDHYLIGAMTYVEEHLDHYLETRL